MFSTLSSEALFYGGIVIMAIAVLTAIVSIIIFSLSGKKLKLRLEREFGKKRH